jgi:hypothetical protein
MKKVTAPHAVTKAHGFFSIETEHGGGSSEKDAGCWMQEASSSIQHLFHRFRSLHCNMNDSYQVWNSPEKSR